MNIDYLFWWLNGVTDRGSFCKQIRREENRGFIFTKIRSANWRIRIRITLNFYIPRKYFKFLDFIFMYCKQFWNLILRSRQFFQEFFFHLIKSRSKFEIIFFNEIWEIWKMEINSLGFLKALLKIFLFKARGIIDYRILQFRIQNKIFPNKFKKPHFHQNVLHENPLNRNLFKFPWFNFASGKKGFSYLHSCCQGNKIEWF
jgi:hypothetical protein